jgi:hypothetical protein
MMAKNYSYFIPIFFKIMISMFTIKAAILSPLTSFVAISIKISLVAMDK